MRGAVLVLASIFAAMALATSPAFGAPVDEAIEAEMPELSDEATGILEDSANSEQSDPDALPPELVDPKIPKLEMEHRLVPLTRSELTRLADVWLEAVRAKTEEVMTAEVAIDRSEGEIAGEVRTHLAELQFERNALFDRFSLVLASWERKAGNAEEDAATIAEYRAYRDAVLLDELRTSELATIYAEVLRWLTDRDGGIALAITIVVVIGSVVGLFVIARLARRFAAKGLARIDRLSRLMQSFLEHAVFWLVLATGVLVAFSLLGMDITPLFAVIGAASFILAFAFQETLGNLASGFMIILNRPFDEGDTVDIGGVAGKVDSVSLVATRLSTFDNQIVLVPNRRVWGDVITNITASPTRRVDLVFGIGYGDSIEDAVEILTDVTLSHRAVLSQPEPVIRLHELADSSVNFICRPWVKTEDYWSVYWDITRQVKQAFDEKGISIPFPQQDVHVHMTNQPAIE